MTTDSSTTIPATYHNATSKNLASLENVANHARSDQESKSSAVVSNVTAAHMGNEAKYLCTSELGRLAKHLRLLGVDTALDLNASPHYLLYLARQENRIVLTTSAKFIRKMQVANDPTKRRRKKESEGREIFFYQSNDDDDDDDDNSSDTDESDPDDSDNDEEEDKNNNDNNRRRRRRSSSSSSNASTPLYWYYQVTSSNFKDQILEVVRYFKIRFDRAALYSRCLKCNARKEAVKDPESVRHKLKPANYEKHKDKLEQCIGCKKIYWDTSYNRRYHNSVNQFAQEYSYHDDDDDDDEGDNNNNNNSGGGGGGGGGNGIAVASSSDFGTFPSSVYTEEEVEDKEKGGERDRIGEDLTTTDIESKCMSTWHLK